MKKLLCVPQFLLELENTIGFYIFDTKSKTCKAKNISYEVDSLIYNYM
jgi:hypothetical protein